ncbi:hypothetical protein ONZ51_g7925 [Trametes cubensis]|uniref:Uncharacterized protein n=1 Tax=Trametes cubensis TaxID=1111947 RepID=A0AAD7TPK9_9APHY|nr:hypothetical protein ONZ51_g7925 [Trametes cubensis]
MSRAGSKGITILKRARARVSPTIVWLNEFDVDAILSMDVRPTQLSEKELPPPLLPPRPPLITPSLSPPSSRIYRLPDHPAPPKQPRLSSTPSRSASSRLLSAQPGELRLEASTRLFAFWDQLAERYNKPLDEDDIVDLRELDFLKDRGVTRSAAQSYTIGYFGTQDARDDSSSQAEEDDVENALEEEEEDGTAQDDSADELDLIGPLQRYRHWRLPPVNEQDPADAEAIREFEEAEKRRRELYGEDEEDDQVVDDAASKSDETGGEEELDAGEVGDQLERSPERPESIAAIDSEDTDEEQEKSSPPPPVTPLRSKTKPPISLPPPVDDDSSEDELAKWEIDDTPIPPRRSVSVANDVIDLTISRSPSPSTPRGRSQSHPRAQSHAPVRARSLSQPRRAKAILKQRVEKTSQPSPRSPSSRFLQLLTPPRSSCSAPDIPPLDEHHERAGSPSPKMPRARSRYIPRPRSPTIKNASTSTQGSLEIAGQSLPSKSPQSISKASRSRLRAEVVITTSPHRAHIPSRSSSPDTPLSHKVRSHHSTVDATRSGAIARGKSPHRPSTPEPPLASSTSRKEHSQARSDSEGTYSVQPNPPRGRKRRRVSSPSSSSSDGLSEKARSASTPQSTTRRHQRTGRRQRSGYRPDSALTTSSPVNSAYENAYTQLSLQYSRAMAWTSYLMASGAWPPPPPLPSASDNGLQSSFPFPLYGGSGPSTPSQQIYPPRHSVDFDAPSSEAGPSRLAAYSTPIHYPPMFPQGFHPAYSSGTLPPSSPLPSSPINSSPTLRPASVPPGQRSKARGRRVSFKIDANDRPLSPTPPRHSNVTEDCPDSGRESDDEPLRMHATKHGRREKTPFKPREGKGKGKARAASPSEDSDEDEDGQETSERTGPDRGRRPPRARTPGPPSRREQSVSRGSATSSTQEREAGKRK